NARRHFRFVRALTARRFRWRIPSSRTWLKPESGSEHARKNIVGQNRERKTERDHYAADDFRREGNAGAYLSGARRDCAPPFTRERTNHVDYFRRIEINFRRRRENSAQRRNLADSRERTARGRSDGGYRGHGYFWSATRGLDQENGRVFTRIIVAAVFLRITEERDHGPGTERKSGDCSGGQQRAG